MFSNSYLCAVFYTNLSAVEKFKRFEIELKSLSEGDHEYVYSLDNSFFENIESEICQKGEVSARVLVRRSSLATELYFEVDGEVIISCDRCLDDMIQYIDADARLIVKFGQEYEEESEELIVLPEDDGKINVAWHLFELIALAIPLKHTHEDGDCNKEMEQALSAHIVLEEDPEEEVTDPRWDALKELLK